MKIIVTATSPSTDVVRMLTNANIAHTVEEYDHKLIYRERGQWTSRVIKKTDVFVELDTLEDLSTFMDNVGYELVISNSENSDEHGAALEIEIYNDYRE